jgi:omega-amidase
MQLTISLGQMDVKRGDPEHNLTLVSRWTAEAARRGSDILVLPELWDTGYALAQAHDLGSPVGEGRFVETAGLAEKHGIHIIGSMMEIDRDGKAYNTAVWFDPRGEVPGCYRKIHLFGLMGEDQYLSPGSDLCCVEAPWGKTGLAICYDLRFPELFRAYALAGVVMVIIPAQWPHPRMMHWQTLLRARAIENQMVVAACNRVGEEDGMRFGGKSAVLDAWGETILEGGKQELLLTASVDLQHVTKVRSEMPVFVDRRPEIYDSIEDEV